MNKVDFLKRVLYSIDVLTHSVDHTKIDDVSSDVIFKVSLLSSKALGSLDLFDELGFKNDLIIDFSNEKDK